MTWRLIETVSPTYEWQLLDEPIIGDSTVRAVHNWNGDAPFPGFALIYIGQFDSNGNVHSIRKSYPFKTGRVFDWPVSQPIREDALGVYYPAIKINTYGRVDADANWEFSLYQWQSAVNEAASQEWQDFISGQ
ncbi:MAG: hypothetical protein AAFW84_09705 [Cyanobacteria bacterium J06635_15]